MAKKNLVLLVVVLALGALTTTTFQKKPATGPRSEFIHFKEPSYLKAEENALAMEGLTVMAYVRLGDLSKIYNLVFNQGESPLSQSNGVGLNKAFDVLSHMNINVAKNVHVVLAAAYNKKLEEKFGEKSSYASVVHGMFDVNSVLMGVKSHYDVLPLPPYKNAFSLTAKPNVETCEVGEPLEILLSSNRIILASKGKLNKVAGRIVNKAVASVDINPWRTYKMGKLAALGLFSVNDVVHTVDNPMLKMPLANVTQEAGDIQAIFFGVDAFSSEPKLQLNAKMLAPKAFVTLVAKKYDAWQVVANNVLPEGIVNGRALLSSLTTIQNEDSLMFNMPISKQTTYQLAKLPEEIIGAMFSGFSTGQAEKSIVNPEDVETQLNENPSIYRSGYRVSSIKPHEVNGTFKYTPLVVGPFSFGVGQLVHTSWGMDAEVNKPEIAFTAETGLVLNAPKNNNFDLGSLTILRVENALGQDIMLHEACGRERNDKPKNISLGRFFDADSNLVDKISVTKNINLKEGFTEEDVHRVTGVLQVRVPADISKHVVSDFVAGTTFVKDDVELKFESENVNVNEVAYRAIKGADRVLAVRPMTEAGDYLKISSTLRMNNAVEMEVAGIPKKLEIILMESVDTEEFPIDYTVDR